MGARTRLPGWVYKKLPSVDWKKTVHEYVLAKKSTPTNLPQPLEIACALGAMIYLHGMKYIEAAKHFGEKEGWPSNFIMLLRLSPAVHLYFDTRRPYKDRLRPHEGVLLCALPSDKQIQRAENLLRMRDERGATRLCPQHALKKSNKVRAQPAHPLNRSTIRWREYVENEEM